MNQSDQTKITCRLSQDDGLDGDSNSIQNQKKILEQYAIEHRFPNPRFYVDDRYSGASFNQPEDPGGPEGQGGARGAAGHQSALRLPERCAEKLVIDEESAAVVRRIFAMCAVGSAPSQIARQLKKERILCPTAYAYRKFGITHTSLDLEHPYHWTSSTVANMLENDLYLGNTVNMKYSTKSYKDKRKAEHPREDCLVIEGSHEPLIDQETWDIVQRMRQHKRRRTKMDGQDKYSVQVVCADCGKVMVLHRATPWRSPTTTSPAELTGSWAVRFAPPTISGSVFWTRWYWRTCGV